MKRAEKDLLNAVLEPKRGRIQESLLQFGASKDGEHIGQLARAIFSGDVQQAESLIKSERDMEALLKHKMPPTSTHLTNAIRSGNLDGVDLLLRFGLPVEEPDDTETALMTAAAMGDLAIVQRLVEAGADVNRYADDNAEWTPSFYAQQAGKTDVAKWLRSQMDEELAGKQDRIMEARDPAFRALYENATSGEGTTTDEIVKVLKGWNESFGIAIIAADAASVTVRVSSLPDDIEGFCEEVLQFCPDAAEDRQALQDELTKNMTLGLWWD
ncbi:MAG: ankyrin repeat domain-containing protein [Gammaproteobacteria bacterium]|nr:ankyrin repeat domain-containing protein [Gammaproteobacteria bacterium]